MAFSAGASNVANAVAPLVGSGNISMTTGILVGGLSIGAGGFLLDPRTMETVGEGVTDLSPEAALLVEGIAATIITGLSWAGIPASLAITASTTVIGLGWGRATRREHSPGVPGTHVSGAAADDDGRTTTTSALYDREVNQRIVAAWFATPTLAGLLSFLCFEVALRLDLLAVG
ncbi:MAG: inorganic phosphate transporter [Halobacteriaceae archaeon]